MDNERMPRGYDIQTVLSIMQPDTGVLLRRASIHRDGAIARDKKSSAQNNDVFEDGEIVRAGEGLNE